MRHAGGRRAAVRAAAGAALALAAGGCRDGTGPAAWCFSPAPLEGRADPLAPGYVVRLRDGVDAQAEAARLAARHGFAPRFVFGVLPGFSAELSRQALAGVRCERSVAAVAHNASFLLGAPD